MKNTTRPQLVSDSLYHTPAELQRLAERRFELGMFTAEEQAEITADHARLEAEEARESAVR